MQQDAEKVREISLSKQKVLKERQAYQIGMVRQKKQLLELFGQIKTNKNWKSMGKVDLAAQLSMTSSGSTKRLPPPEGTNDMQRRNSQASGKRGMKPSASAPTLTRS